MAPLLALLTILFGGDAPAKAATPAPTPAVFVEAIDAQDADQPEQTDGDRWIGKVELPGQTIDFVATLIDDDGSLTGRLDIPVQGLTGGMLSGVVREGNEIRFTFQIPNLPEANWPRWAVTVDEAGTTAQGELHQSGATFPVSMVLDETGQREAIARPQNPKRPLPYREIEATISAGEHTLAGTLTLPSVEEFGEGPFPGAVLITGSGPQDRDESILGHRPFYVLSDRLTRRGIAVLRCDDRGVGESTGDFVSATTLDFVEDARASAAWLAQRTEIEGVGLIGHSEGGLVAPFVANGNDTIDFVVLLAGPGVPGREVMARQIVEVQKAGGLNNDENLQAQVAAQQSAFDAILADNDEAARQAFDELITLQYELVGEELVDPAVLQGQIEAQMNSLSTPWFRTFLTLDPRPALARMTQPVLALNGSLDAQVLSDQNLPEIERVFAEAGKSEMLEAEEIEGLNHLFQPTQTGSLDEYAQIETTFDESVMDRIGSWILKNMR